LLGYSPASPLPLFSRCVFFCHGDRRHPPSFPTRRSSDLIGMPGAEAYASVLNRLAEVGGTAQTGEAAYYAVSDAPALEQALLEIDRKSTRLNSSHVKISYAVFCLKKNTQSHFLNSLPQYN